MTHPPDEEARIKRLESYAILETEHEKAFDDLTVLASQICQSPVAFITLIDAKRQWFKSTVGIRRRVVPRDISLCNDTLHQSEGLTIGDVTKDRRFTSNPLIAEDHLRFYSGVPFFSNDGFALGTLCVMDRKPRKLTTGQKEALRALSRQVGCQLELRRYSIESRLIRDETQRLSRELDTSLV